MSRVDENETGVLACPEKVSGPTYPSVPTRPIFPLNCSMSVFAAAGARLTTPPATDQYGLTPQTSVLQREAADRAKIAAKQDAAKARIARFQDSRALSMGVRYPVHFLMFSLISDVFDSSSELQLVCVVCKLRCRCALLCVRRHSSRAAAVPRRWTRTRLIASVRRRRSCVAHSWKLTANMVRACR